MSRIYYDPATSTFQGSHSHGRAELGGYSTSFSRLFMDSRAADTAEAAPPQSAPTDDPAFDILEWYPAFQSCQRYFLDISQYEPGTQALCSLINIRLPFQWLIAPVQAYPLQSPPPSSTAPFTTFPPTRPGTINSPDRSRTSSHAAPAADVSLIPYVRRLIVTGFDKPAILHGFFGDDYTRGVMPHVECERRNYLFSAKAGGWRSCKKQYDVGSAGGGDETVPFMKPLDEARMEELTAAEKAWSDWLAMEDWMVGPRAPAGPVPSRTPGFVENSMMTGATDSINGSSRQGIS